MFLLISDGNDSDTSSQQVTEVMSGKLFQFIKIQTFHQSSEYIHVLNRWVQ